MSAYAVGDGQAVHAAIVTEYIAKYVPDRWFVESTEINLLAAALLSLSGITATSSNVLLRFLG